MEGHDNELRTQLVGTTAELQRLQEELSGSAVTVPAPPPASPARSSESSDKESKSGLVGLAQRLFDAGRSAIGDKPGAAVVVRDGGGPARANAVRRRDELAEQSRTLQHELDASQPATEAARAALVAATADLADRAQALAGLRQQLSAALADVTFGARALGSTAAGTAPRPSRAALAGIPTGYLDLYRAAAPTCPGLSWTVLAAIGSIESAHGQSQAVGVHTGANVAGAMGPMQFLAPTWAAYGVDGGGDGIRDPYNPADAVFGAANYLCINGAGDPARLAGAIWDYNHADWYVRAVLDLAARYGGAGLDAAAEPDAAALVVNPNLTLSAQAAADLLGGRIDPRVVRVLAAVSATHRITLSVLETGHAQFVKGTDRVSNHYHGRAVDITEVDGSPVSPSNGAALELVLALLTGDPSLRPDELGSPWPEMSQFAGAFTDGDHQDHLHLGW